MGLTWRQKILGHWRLVTLIAYPLLLSTIFAIDRSMKYKAIFIALVLIGYSFFHVMPYAVIGFLPLILFPLLNISSPVKTALFYFTEQIALSIGGNIIALALKKSGLLTRISLKLILASRCDLRILLLVIAIICMLLAMILMDIMAVVIWSVLLEELLEYLDLQGICRCYKYDDDSELDEKNLNHEEYQNELEANIIEPSRSSYKRHTIASSASASRYSLIEAIEHRRNRDRKPTNVTKCFYLTVLFSCQFGGLSLLYGNLNNVDLPIFWESEFPNIPCPLSPYKWPLHVFPYAVVCMAVTWTFLQWALFGLFRPKSNIYAQISFTPGVKRAIKEVVDGSLEEMGEPPFRESSLTCCLVFYAYVYISVGIFIAHSLTFVFSLTFWLVTLIFCLPSKNVVDIFNKDVSKQPTEESPPILPWRVVQEKVLWQVIFVIGGSGAMSFAFRHIAFEDVLINCNMSSPYLTTVITCLYTMLVTQFVNNGEMPAVVLKGLVNISAEEDVHPLRHLIPATICCSFGDCFYMSSILVCVIGYSSNISTKDLCKYNVVIILICYLILMMVSDILFLFVYNLDSFPK